MNEQDKPAQHGPYHRTGSPGGPGCAVGTLPIKIKRPDGALLSAALLDAGANATELELLRTVANGLGIKWGLDEFGWWAIVPGSEKEGQTLSDTARHASPKSNTVERSDFQPTSSEECLRVLNQKILPQIGHGCSPIESICQCSGLIGENPFLRLAANAALSPSGARSLVGETSSG